MTIGLDVVGRPSCYGGVDQIRIIVRNQKYRRVIIVSDNDENPDARRNVLLGLQSLASALFVPRCILDLPAKGMRQFVINGGTSAMLYYLVKNALWSRPNQER